MPGVRLQPNEIAAIRMAAKSAFGEDVVVRLFGSRCDPARKGGDIDLHFEVARGVATDAAVEQFEAQLFRAIDPQKVDKIFTERGSSPCIFGQIAMRDGIAL